MDAAIKEEFRRAFLLSWPSLPVEHLDDADLVFDYSVDIDSLEEFLVEQGRALSLEFDLDLRIFYPGWFSPFFHTRGAFFEDYLKRHGKRRFPKLTVTRIWQSARESRAD